MARLGVDPLHAGVRSRRRRVPGAGSVADVVPALAQPIDLPRAFVAQVVHRATIAALLHVRRVERRGRLRVERCQSPAHGRCDAASRELPERRMLAERGREIPEHRIRIAGDGHQIGWCGEIDDAPRRLL